MSTLEELRDLHDTMQDLWDTCTTPARAAATGSVISHIRPKCQCLGKLILLSMSKTKASNYLELKPILDMQLA